MSPEDVIDRDAELARMLDAAESANNTRLLAPREYGKTSLLRKLLAEADRLGWATVYVDFFGILSLGDAAARIENAYATELRGDLATWFEGFRRRFKRGQIGGGPVPASVEVELGPQSEVPLIERLATPRRILEREGRRTLVVFDEFQDVLTARADADEVIRSEIQHHGEAASYVFAGSEVGMMRELFGDRRRAFYRQAQRVDLAPLEPGELGEYVSDRFAATGRSVAADALGRLLDLSQGHPRAAMLLAHELWRQTESGGTAGEAEFDRAELFALEQAGGDLRGLWRGLSKPERGIVTALARGEAPFSRHRSDAGGRGSAPQRAMRSLIDLGEVVETAGGHRLVDPLFAELIRQDWNPTP